MTEQTEGPKVEILQKEVREARLTVRELQSELNETLRKLQSATAERDDALRKLQSLQPSDLNAGTAPTAIYTAPEAHPSGQAPARERLPEERRSVTHHFTIHAASGSIDGYLIVGLYNDGRVGELFVRIAKVGDTVAGFADQWAQAMSLLLQLGVPLRELCGRFAHTRFEPSGRTTSEHVRHAHSIIDYVCRYLMHRFCGEETSGESA